MATLLSLLRPAKGASRVAQRCLSTSSPTAVASTTVAGPSSSANTLDTTLPNPSSTSDAITYLRSQPLHYVVANLLGTRHLLAPRDILTIPRLKTVNVGDRLILSDIHEVGSRDYTLRASTLGRESLPNGLVNVEATVLEHTKGPMERIVKFKRRKHYQKTIKHKQTYTRLRIGPIGFGQPATS